MLNWAKILRPLSSTWYQVCYLTVTKKNANVYFYWNIVLKLISMTAGLVHVMLHLGTVSVARCILIDVRSSVLIKQALKYWLFSKMTCASVLLSGQTVKRYIFVFLFINVSVSWLHVDLIFLSCHQKVLLNS